MITYEAKPINEVANELLADFTTQKPWVVIRTSEISSKVWLFTTSEAAAKAACRRYRSRDVVTR